jgi:hypothetical protein
VSRDASAILAFDTYSVAIPAVLAGMFLRIPVVIRIGGDFVWESYLERTRDLIPLPDFYLTRRDLSPKERFARRLVEWMLRHAQLAFNTAWLLEIWRMPYGIDSTRAHVVENAIGERLESADRTDRSILLFGRPIILKNHEAFRLAFDDARTSGTDLMLDEGMVPHAELMRKIQDCYAVAIPSISEVAPNSAIDAIRCGKPLILTKHSGYAERYKEMAIIIDPLDHADMVRGIKDIADPVIYERLTAAIAAYTPVRTYDDVARELLAILS